MAFTPKQMEYIRSTQVSLDELSNIEGLNNEYYLQPLTAIEDKLGFTPKVSIQDYRFAVEMANDENVCPENADMNVIVDGILAFLFYEALEVVGIDLTTYFTYRFHPPSQEFQAKLDAFEAIIKEAN